MNRSKTRMRAALMVLAFITGCSSGGAVTDGAASGSDVGTAADVGVGADIGAGVDGAATADLGSAPDLVASRVPTEHRAQAKECQATERGLPDAGGRLCSNDGDCAGDAGAPFTHCLRGRCSFDACLSDSDCTANNGVCGCSTDYYGGNGAYHPNVCAPANCHVDADCGAGGFCTPTRGYCGVFTGFYCHRPTDACYNASECPAPPGGGLPGCLYTPTVGKFVCSTGSVCQG